MKASRKYHHVKNHFSELPKSQNTRMGTTQGCINVLLWLQAAVYLPLQISPDGTEIRPRKEFLSKNKYSWALMCWMCLKITFLTFSTLSLFYVKHLYMKWQECNNIQQLCLYTLIFSLTSMGLAAINLMEDQQFSFAGTQSLKVAKFRTAAHPFTKRLPGFHESGIYIFAGGLFLMVALVILIPFVLEYHPLGLLTQSVLTSPCPTYAKMLSNLLGSLLYACMFLHGGGSWMFVFCVIASFGESVQVVSRRLCMDKAWWAQEHDRHDASVTKLCKFHSTVRDFTECWRLYNNIRILVHAGNQAVEIFLQALLIMGCLLAIGSGFAIIMLFDRIPFTFYLSAMVLLPLVIAGIFILVALASTPRENGNKFRHFWSAKLVMRIDFARLRACPPIGYSFGFIRNCKRCTALSIIDVIVNSIASVTLLKFD